MGSIPRVWFLDKRLRRQGDKNAQERIRCARTKPFKCLRTLIPPLPSLQMSAKPATSRSNLTGTHLLVLTSIPLGMSPVALLKLPQKPLLEIWYQGVNEAE